MTQNSGFWTTSGTPTGHQVASYTQVIASVAFEIMAACSGKEGVAPSYLNELVGSVPSANTARIGTGGAMADGKWFKNDAAVDITIPSAVGGGNTRIDRIVVRVNWANFQATIIRIAGTDAASPTAPAITQISGTTYDIKLYQALVDTSGNVTLTDERTWGIVAVDESTLTNISGTLQVKDDGIGNDKLRNSAAMSVIGRAGSASGNPADIAPTAGSQFLGANAGMTAIGFITVPTAGIADNAVDDTKIRDSAAVSVIGRSAFSAGNPADIQANTGNDRLLARVADALAWVQLTIGMIPDLLITGAKIVADAIDDTKVGNRVPQFYRRQGGDATAWDIPGTTTRTPTTVRMQAGAVQVTIANASDSGLAVVTFPVAFSAAPLVFVTFADASSGVSPDAGDPNNNPMLSVESGGLTLTIEFGIQLFREGTTGAKTYTINWLAIGPE